MKIIEVNQWPEILENYLHVWNPNFKDMDVFDIKQRFDNLTHFYQGYKIGYFYRPASIVFLRK